MYKALRRGNFCRSAAQPQEPGEEIACFSNASSCSAPDATLSSQRKPWLWQSAKAIDLPMEITIFQFAYCDLLYISIRIHIAPNKNPRKKIAGDECFIEIV